MDQASFAFAKSTRVHVQHCACSDHSSADFFSQAAKAVVRVRSYTQHGWATTALLALASPEDYGGGLSGGRPLFQD